MPTTSDKNDPRLTHGVDQEPTGQAEVYLVLSDEERAKGFVRPVRRSYLHVGRPGPLLPLRDLTDDEHERYDEFHYVKFEQYLESTTGVGRFWTQEQLDKVGDGCGARTTMSWDIAETYARNPGFYGATYCVRCGRHLPVGKDGEFVWDDAFLERVGT
jgi:hypothetical protein